MLNRCPACAGIGDDVVSHDTTQQGFSLAEMMATLAIAAVTASMAVPTMKNIVVNGQRATAANELVSTMHAARSTAITRNEQVTICPSSNAERCNDDAQWQDGWVYFIDSDHDRRVDANDKVLGSTTGIADVTIQSEDFEQFLTFRPNGQIMVNTTSENSGEMLLCDIRGPEFSRSLVLHVGGKPQLMVNEATNAYAACPTT